MTAQRESADYTAMMSWYMRMADAMWNPRKFNFPGWCRLSRELDRNVWDRIGDDERIRLDAAYNDRVAQLRSHAMTDPPESGDYTAMLAWHLRLADVVGRGLEDQSEYDAIQNDFDNHAWYRLSTADHDRLLAAYEAALPSFSLPDPKDQR
jgi:hypothetical protein